MPFHGGGNSIMEQDVTVKIPRTWIKGLPEEELTLKQIFRLGIYQYKVERAIQLYRDGVGSLGYVAEQMGLNKQDLIREARHHNIDPEYSEQTVKEELSKWH
jgi:predicted HTH domain antitoxin